MTALSPLPVPGHPSPHSHCVALQRIALALNGSRYHAGRLALTCRQIKTLAAAALHGQAGERECLEQILALLEKSR